MAMQYRELGGMGLRVSVVAMGCWPISGLTSLDVNRDDSLETIREAFSGGVNFFDTAWSYGSSEELLAEALGPQRESVVIATKGGLDREQGRQFHDAKPASLKRQCEGSLRRLGTDRVELYYLHARDPAVPVSESAGAIAELISAGKVRGAGASNLTLAELQEFHDVCPLTAIQPAYNMLQREIEQDILPWCREQGIAVCVYWPLLKGLLAGKLPRDHVFPEGDGRRKYPMFQGTEWIKNQDLLDDLRLIAGRAGVALSTLVVAWTVRQAGITTALCGAKRPWQIRESAVAGGFELTQDILDDIETALQRRGVAVTRAAV